MTLKGGTGGACAACKYQRRRCTADCKLAPYFPAENPKLFQQVHKLFGVRNIVKMLESIDEEHQPEAMKSIIFEAEVRDRFPVQGSLGFTQNLQYEIFLYERVLKALNSQLQFYRSLHQNQNRQHNQLDLRMGINESNFVTPFFSPIPLTETQPLPVPVPYGDINNNSYSTPAFKTNRGKEILTNNNNDLWGDDQNLYTHFLQDGEEGSHEYDDIREYFKMNEKQPSFTDTKEANASTSSGQSLKEPNDEIEDNDLRGAAN